MTTKTLTDSAIKVLSPGETIWDKVVTGLHVRCSQTAKNFYLYYRVKNGVARRPKIGASGILSIAEARAIARESHATVAAGGDPSANRRLSQGEPTVAEFFERCWREHWSRKKDARNVRRLYESRVAPRLGHQRVRELCYQDIAGLHSALAATPVEANRTLALISKLLNLAERYGERGLGSNPCRHVSRYPELSRRRFATVDELSRLGPLLDASWAVLPDSVAFIGLMVFTGMRPGEVEAGRRDWVAGSVLRLPDSKTGQRDIYLPPQALGILERLPAPPVGQDGLTPLVGVKYPRRLWERLRGEAGCPDLWLYDLRRTFATVSLAGGTSSSLIGEMLGHKTAQTTKVYARLMDRAAQGAAADTGDRMARLLTASP